MPKPARPPMSMILLKPEITLPVSITFLMLPMIRLSEAVIKEIHRMLKSSTSDSETDLINRKGAAQHQKRESIDALDFATL
jgi:hypothetical protein